MDFDPIKQLQSLLEDRGKVLEKISSIHSALGSVTAPPAAVPEPPPDESTPPNQDLVYGRLLQALGDMQVQIEQRVRPMAQQVVDAQVAQLREQSGYDHGALQQCLAKIDQCILTCLDRVDEYQTKRSSLIAVNTRLSALGALPEALPEELKTLDLNEAIRSRIESLAQRRRL